MRTSRIAEFLVARSEGGLTLQAFLSARQQISRRRAKLAIDARSVWVNRRRVWMAHHLVQPGDRVQAPLVDGQPVPPPRLRILLESPHYLFVDKPAGLLATGDGSAEELLRVQTGLAELRAVHRLDRDTSGCLLVARTEADFTAAVAPFRQRRVGKLYHAIVRGRVERQASTLDRPIDGERAVTHIRLLCARPTASFVAVRIETGRTHQIRQHLASIRHPVLGDRQYGPARETDPLLQTVPRQMLHSSEIELPDPFGSGILRGHSPLPADFRGILRRLNL